MYNKKKLSGAPWFFTPLRHIAIAWWCFLGLLAPVQVFAEATARFDRASVTLGQTVNLVLEVSDYGTKIQPDLSMLKGVFEIVGRPRSETQFRSVNGTTTSLARFVVTLAPLEVGRVRIPGLAVGPFTTPPLHLEVRAPATGADGESVATVFVEAVAEPNEPYLQSEVRYKVRLFHLDDLLGGNLSEPSMEDALVLKMGDDVTSKETRHGRNYQVIERSYAIFPQASGELTIPAPVFNGEVSPPPDANGGVVQGSTLGIDPFGGFFQASQKVFARGPVLTIRVRPPPQSFRGHTWLAAESVTLSESWSARPLQFKVGEPATRTISLTAVGVTASQLPELDLGKSPTLKMYPDQPVAKTQSAAGKMVANLALKVAVVPTSPGEFTLPEITLHWWDTHADQARTAKIPARKITVFAAPQNEANNTAVRDAPTNDASAAAASEKREVSVQWPIATMILLIAWLVTMVLWLRERKHKSLKIDSAPQSSSIRQIRTALSAACKAGDAQTAKDALLRWAQAIWTNEQTSSLLSLAEKLDDPAARSALNGLEQYLYGHAKTWDGESCWRPLKNALKARRAPTATPPKNPYLPALYPD
jgi:hypothetical protein